MVDVVFWVARVVRVLFVGRFCGALVMELSKSVEKCWSSSRFSMLVARDWF